MHVLMDFCRRWFVICICYVHHAWAWRSNHWTRQIEFIRQEKKLCAGESFFFFALLWTWPSGIGTCRRRYDGDDAAVRTHHHAHAYAAQVRTRRRPNASEQLCLPDQSAPGTPIRPVRVWIRMHVASCYSMLVSVLSGWADILWRGRVPMDCSGWAGRMVLL
jgi:hypothetical protein